MRTLLLFVVALGVGCGGLDPQFAGVWTGTMVQTVSSVGYPDGVDSTPNATVTIEESAGAQYLVTCGARMKLEGSGGHATWEGIQSCPTPAPNCAAATLIYRSAEGTLSGGRLNATLHSDGAACGYNASVTYEFSGTK